MDDSKKPNTKNVDMPPVAVFCTLLAWLALIGGALALIGGLVDSLNPHVSGSGAAVVSGAALLFSSIIWFLGRGR